MRAQAHERAERGTSCCLAGTCECGGAYKHDPEINARVVDAIKADKRFRRHERLGDDDAQVRHAAGMRA